MIGGHLDAEIDTALQKYGLDEDLLREYDLHELQAHGVAGAMRVQGVRQDLYIKRSALGCGALGRIDQVLMRLHQCGIPVARLVRTKYGDAFVSRPDGVFYATRAVPGHPPRMERVEVLQAAARLLARWHAAALAAPGELLSVHRLDIPGQLMNDLARLEVYRQIVLAGPEPDPEPGSVDEVFLQIRVALAEEIRGVLVHLRDQDYPGLCRTALQSGVLCHGSFVRQNMVWHEGRLVILDHDHVYAGPQVLDVAAFLRRYMRFQDWDGDVLAEVWQAYQDIQAVNATERPILPALLVYPEAVMRVLRWHYEKIVMAPEDEVAEALLREWEWHQAARQTLLTRTGYCSPAAQAGDVQETTMASGESPFIGDEAEEEVPGLTRFWRSLRRHTD